LNTKKKESRPWVWGILVVAVLLPVLILLIKRMEGTPPALQLELASPTMGAGQTFSVHVEDPKSGVRQVWVAVLQNGKETVLLDRFFPSGGLTSGGAVRQETLSVPLDVQGAGLKDGPAMLRLVVRDFSWRKWGKGNQTYQDQEVIIDTKPPVVEVLSSVHNLNQGGAGLVIYRISEECPTSGVMVGETFYPGRTGYFNDAGIFMTFIALNHRQGPGTQMHVAATDFAGNQGRSGFAYHINGRRFKKDRITISEGFLNRKMPEFRSAVGASGNETLLQTFLKVNRDMRKANYDALSEVTRKSDNGLHWQGVFTRLPRAANRAGFADHRTYTFSGKEIDQQTHLGVDLASVQQSPVPAGNRGRVAFAEYLGIYGNTVVLDHGFGLFSMYAHLSHIDVTPDQMVEKGAIVGKTGYTGLAGGDHLHYSMLVHQTFVNPLEWWDARWIENNIESKLKAIP
jgi:hypothetical protein